MKTYINKSNLMSYCMLSVFSKIPTHTLLIKEKLIYTFPEELATALQMSTTFVCDEVKRGALQQWDPSWDVGISSYIEIKGVKDYLCNRFFPSHPSYEMMLYWTIPSRRAYYLTNFFNRQEERDFPHLLSVNTCSDFLRVSKYNIYKLLHNNALPYFRFGSRYRIPKVFICEAFSAMGREELNCLEALHKRDLI